jgi:hypothetical protein
MAALGFATVGWLMADAYVPNMAEVANVGYFRELTAALGAIVGWQVMGNSVGRSYYDAIGSGWKTVIVLIVYALLLFAIYDMLLMSVRMVYEDPLEAIVDIFNRMLKRAGPLFSVGVIMVGVIGGGIVGLLTENANRRWR